MARVEQPELHELVGPDIVDELHADWLECGPPQREVVLDDPLRKRLRRDRPAIFDAELACDGLAISVGRGGRDPVHHAVGKRHIRVDPVC